MSLVDILIWAVVLIFFAKGFWKGLVREVCTLAGLVAGGWAAFRYSSPLAEVMRPFIHLPEHVAGALAFLVIFFLIGLLFFLIGYLLTVVFKIMLLGGINRVGGALFGLLEGAFILCMVLALGTTSPMPVKLRAALERSPSARPFIQTGNDIIAGWNGPVKQARPARPAKAAAPARK
jgi:membrane protein required for colicin V production